MDNRGGFQSRAAFRAEHPSALAVYCSDGRFTDAIEELLHAMGHERLDTLTMPGGAALLHPFSARLIEHEALVGASRFLIVGHGITHTVLIAHAGCGYYRARYAGEEPERLEQRQREDLRGARAKLMAEHAGMKVDLFYARPVGGVRFEGVS
jgi:hypothetical protein